MSVKFPTVSENDVPLWPEYRAWFRETWAEGGSVAWAVALGHLLVGMVLCWAVLSFKLTSLPVGGSLIAFIYLLVILATFYVAFAPPAEPYLAYLRDLWLDDDVTKFAIVVGHVIVGYALVAILLGLSFNGLVGTLSNVFFFTAVFSMMVLALNLHWGYAGIFNIGIAGFMAVGVYVMAIVSTTPNPGAGQVPGFGMPLPIGILAGVVAAAVVGLLAALPALRLRADYFAIVTVALSEMIRFSLKSTTFQQFTIGGVTTGTGGATGITLPGNPIRLLFFESHEPGAGPALLGSVLFPLFRDLKTTLIPPDSYLYIGIGYLKLPAFVLDLAVEPAVIVNIAYVVVLFVWVGIFYWILARVGNSPFGRVLKAIREDETVAQALGKDTRRFKIVAFMVGCGLMGLGGILWLGSQGFTNPGAFKPIPTFYIWIALIIGGAGSNTGSVLGGALFASLLWSGPVYAKNVITNFVSLPATPNTFADAIGPVFVGNVVPIVSYLLDNVSNVRFVLFGVILVWLMQNRPEGLLGHRKEEAASIPLSRRRGESAATATDGGEAGE